MTWFLQERAGMNYTEMDDKYMYVALNLFIAADWGK